MATAEWIKSIFDVVRNYGLAAAVALGGSLLGQRTSALESTFYLYVSWTLVVMGYLLFLLNIAFSVVLLHGSPFFEARRHGSIWPDAAIVLAVLFGFLLGGAAISFQVASRAN